MSRSRIWIEFKRDRVIRDLQNGHPPSSGYLHCTNNDHVTAGDTTISYPPRRNVSGDRGVIILRRHKGVSIVPGTMGRWITEREPHREKSINYARDQLRKPSQRDFVAVSRLIPYLDLLFQRLIARPLEGMQWGGKPRKPNV